MRTAIQYVRFSSKPQELGDSERRQVEAGRAWAAANGYQYRQMVDRGLSAYHGDHLTKGLLGSFLVEVRARRVETGSVLIVEALDRLSRQKIVDALFLVLDILRHGVAIHDLFANKTYTAQEEIAGLLQIALTSSAGHGESSNKATRVREAWDGIRKAAATGRPVTATIPYGYAIEGRVRSATGKITAPGKFVVDEAKARVVRAIFRLTAEGWSQNGIARFLNGGRHSGAQERRYSQQQRRRMPVPDDLGFKVPVPAPARRMKKVPAWSQATIRFMLRNRSYLGEYQPCTGNVARGTRVPAGDVIRTYYPVIIDQTLWDRAHRSTAGAAAKGRKPHRMGPTNLLTGINRCGHCSTPGTVSIKQSLRSAPRKFICRKGRDGTGICVYREILAAPVERGILAALRQHVDPARMLQTIEASDAASDLVAERDALKAEIKRLSKEASATEGWAISNRVVGAILEKAMADVERVRGEAEGATRRLEAVERELAGLSEVASSLTQVVFDLDRLIPYAAGDPLPVQVASPIVGKVPQVLAEAEARRALGEEQRDAVRVELKMVLAKVVREVRVDCVSGTWELDLVDGQTIKGMAKEDEAVDSFRLLADPASLGDSVLGPT